MCVCVLCVCVCYACVCVNVCVCVCYVCVRVHVCMCVCLWYRHAEDNMISRYASMINFPRHQGSLHWQ